MLDSSGGFFLAMDGCGYALAISQHRSVKKGKQRCRPLSLRREDPVFFTVNPQWSHQHRYESGCKKSLAFLWIGQSCWSSLSHGVSNTNAGFFLDIYFAYQPFSPRNCFAFLSLLFFSSPCSAIQFIATCHQWGKKALFSAMYLTRYSGVYCCLSRITSEGGWERNKK